MNKVKAELYNDNFQNYKRYNIPKAQLVVADIPYNLGVNAYASSTEWYIDGDNRNGESKKAGKAFFLTDTNFNIAEYMHFCSRLLKKEPKEKGKAPAMLVFCSFQQLPIVIRYGEKYGFRHHIPLVFIKNYSAQVLKANMKIVGATEYGLVLYRDKLPKFNNGGMLLCAIIMPMQMLSEEFMERLEDLRDLCRMQYQNEKAKQLAAETQIKMTEAAGED